MDKVHTVLKRPSKSLTLTEEHVPHTQHRGPGQRSREGTHEPLCHVEDRVNLVFLQMPVGHRGHALEQSEQDLAV